MPARSRVAERLVDHDAGPRFIAHASGAPAGDAVDRRVSGQVVTAEQSELSMSTTVPSRSKLIVSSIDSDDRLQSTASS